ncbi:amidohydrolase [Bifidobacterium goeldii]|uniref:Amidohydrolase n=1 Tax=Bifidobacterium goeldii TaxID=2306975 RepID=A0A430FKR9_9BIFI|nr:amidohydrolase family protein [Bifidobacterium goeldii]RSX53298.1 amidohydrolase [Bifidobacterium goeldii]
MSAHDSGTLDIIDAHFHIWNPAVQRLPWLDNADPALRRHWSLDMFKAAYAPFAPDGVRLLGGVYVEVDCDDPEQEDRFIASNHDPLILARVMRACTKPWMRVPLFADGVRDPLHIPSSQPGRCMDDEFIGGLRMLGAAGLPFDVCARINELDDVAAAHEQAPDTTMVIDHMGNVTPTDFTEQYRESMRRLAAQPNTYIKVSGYPTADRAFVRDLLAFSRETFAGRRMYASNWPVVGTYSSFEEHLRMLIDEEGHDESLFRDTAAQVYHIDMANATSIASLADGANQTIDNTTIIANTAKETTWEPSLKACFALLSR